MSSSYELDAARGELIAACGDGIVEVIRSALCSPSQRAAALNVLWYLPVEMSKRLLPDLLRLAAFQHGSIQLVRARIMSLPRTWLLANIEADAEPLLTSGEDEPFRRLLELYAEIDRELMLRLARRAQAHPNPHVKEAATDFLRT